MSIVFNHKKHQFKLYLSLVVFLIYSTQIETFCQRLGCLRFECLSACLILLVHGKSGNWHGIWEDTFQLKVDIDAYAYEHSLSVVCPSSIFYSCAFFFVLADARVAYLSRIIGLFTLVW